MSENLAQHRESLALRLETLIRIRWLAVIGQTIAVLFVHFFMGFELLLLPCLLLIAMSAWLNVFLRLRYPGNVRWRGRAVTALLGYDILQLSVLLYLTGGIQNPFAILIAVPVVISAASQRVRNFFPLLGFALGISLLLVFFHQPLPWFETKSLSLPLELKGGIWVAIASTICFTAIYIFRVADESRKLADALAATELVLQREQLMTSLDSLSAAAAHELGTPLATISLVTKEMLNETEETSVLREDLELLKSQADRCRDILQKISSLSSEGDDNIEMLSIGVLMEEIATPYRDTRNEVLISMLGRGDPPSIRRNAAILYGISNLLENAVDFAEHTIRFEADWSDEAVWLTIGDDGPGFAEEIFEKIGDPFISRRSSTGIETGGGLGLGLFIAKTLLERNGARLTFSNHRDGDVSGAMVEILWPRQVFENGINA